MNNKKVNNISKTQKDRDPVVTRSILNSTLDERFDKFEGKMNQKIQDESYEIKVMLKEAVNTIMNHIDYLVGESKTNEEERIISAYRQAQHSDRIEKLEKKVFGKVQSV